MDRLTDAVELLDGPLDDPVALADNLRDLRRVNRWLGGVALRVGRVAALAAHRSDLAVLDVGTGGADIPLALLARRRPSWPDAPRRRTRQPARGAGGGATGRRPRWPSRPV